MKSSRKRLCSLCPWFFKSFWMNSKGMGSTELRNFGEVAVVEKEDRLYTSLRDVIAAQKRRPSLTTEMDDLGLRLNTRNCSPKSLLLEKAAQAWLQPSVLEYNRQQTNFFSRCWQKITNQGSTTPSSPPATPLPNTSWSNCVDHLPFLKWLDMSQTFNRTRGLPHPPLLRQ